MLGAGGLAGAYLAHWFPRFKDRMEVTAVVDINPEALERGGEIAGVAPSHRFGSMSEAFEKVEADWCCVVVPPAFHCEAVLAANARGLPVLCEKPISDTWASAVTMYAAVSQRNLPVQIVQNYRYTPRILAAHEVIQSGRIGAPRLAIARFAEDYRQRFAWGKFRHEIPHSLLIEGAVHHFDQIRNLTGSDCKTVTGREWNPGHPSFDGECCAAFVFTLSNGVTAMYEGDCLAAAYPNGWYGEMYRVECENGAVVIDRDQSVRIIERVPAGGYRIEEAALPRPEFEAHLSVIDQFLRWREGGSAPECTIDDNIKSVAMVFGAIEASARSTVVDVPAMLREAGVAA
jgi:predicted dehydrogenase